jgi:hypothetical protein
MEALGSALAINVSTNADDSPFAEKRTILSAMI